MLDCIATGFSHLLCSSASQMLTEFVLQALFLLPSLCQLVEAATTAVAHREKTLVYLLKAPSLNNKTSLHPQSLCPWPTTYPSFIHTHLSEAPNLCPLDPVIFITKPSVGLFLESILALPRHSFLPIPGSSYFTYLPKNSIILGSEEGS